MTYRGPDVVGSRRAEFQDWAATHGLVVDPAVRIIEGLFCGARIHLDTGIRDEALWPIIVDVTAPLEGGELLSELVRAPHIPRSLTSIARSRRGARVRFRPTARLEHIEAVIVALPRSAGDRPYR